MRILFVNQVYAPDVAASAQLLQDMAEHFAAAQSEDGQGKAHEVAVVASKSLYGKTGASLPAYEEINGVRVRRVGAAWFGTRKIFGRSFDAVLFYLAALWAAWRTRLPGGKPEVIVTLTSPPYIGLIGTLIRTIRRGRTRHVYWSMDLYPEVLTAAGVVRETSVLGRTMAWLNRHCMRRADRVVVVGRCMHDRVAGQGVAAEKIEIASVWPVSAPLDGPVPGPPSRYRATWELQDKFVVMYSGNLGMAHEAQTLCEAAKLLQHREDVVFVFAGGGRRRDEVSAFVRKHGLTNVVEKGYEPREHLEELLRLGDVHLISQDNGFTGVVVPCKLFGIMASGRGALYVGPPEAEVARVIADEDCGVVLPLGAAQDLADAIEAAADDPVRARGWGQRALDAARTHHSLADRTVRWERLLAGVVAEIPGQKAAPAAAATAAGAMTARTLGSATAQSGLADAAPQTVLLINQAYAPDIAATAQISEDLCRYLVEQGHRVKVIASRSIYGQSGAQLPRREDRGGVCVLRVGTSLFGKRGLALRLIDFGLFYLAATWAAFRTTLAAEPGARPRRPDVVITLTTPPFIGVVGSMMRRLRGCKHIYWAMDLYPDVLTAAGVMREGALTTRLLERVNHHCMSHADRVVVLGRCMQQRVLNQGVAAENIDTIGIWAVNAPGRATEPEDSPYRAEWGLAGKRVVMYSGNFGLAHDVDTILQAMLELRDRNDVQFVFVGAGKRIPQVEAFVAEHGLTNVMFQPYQPRERLNDLLGCADVHLVSQSEAFTGVVVPSKLLGIMCAARGSLFVGPAIAEVGQIIRETDAGRVVELGDSTALARALTEVADDPAVARRWGEHARVAVEQEHSALLRCQQWRALISDAQIAPSEAASPAATEQQATT